MPKGNTIVWSNPLLSSHTIPCYHGVQHVIKSCNDIIINHFQVYGDSNLLIKWIKRSGQILNIHLKTLGDQVNLIANLFEVIFWKGSPPKSRDGLVPITEDNYHWSNFNEYGNGKHFVSEPNWACYDSYFFLYLSIFGWYVVTNEISSRSIM